MKQTNRFVFDMLDQDLPEAASDRIFRAGLPVSADAENGTVVVKVPFVRQVLKNMFLFPAEDENPALKDVYLRSYGDMIMRITSAATLPDDSANPMFSFAADLKQTPLTVETVSSTEEGWLIKDNSGKRRAFINTKQEKREIWSTLQPEPPAVLDGAVYPDGKTAVPCNCPV
ncbi:MAG: hypothetical protein J5597_08155 [Spirochaetaceae bacterium]|nr:hypothetical protein [Spirochaetaceae bacterium]